MASITSLGVGSGLDLNTLLTELSAAESKQLDLLKNKQAAYQAKVSAYGNVKSMLAAFQASAKKLADTATFSVTKASVGSTEILGAATASNATPGSYTVNVKSLAQAQSLVAAGQASQTRAIGTGTLVFDFGSVSGYDEDPASPTYGTYVNPAFSATADATKKVTIDSSNNTLQGIRDAINKAGIGVTASIANDGSNTPYRIVLTSDKTGAATTMRISASSPELQGLLGYDPEQANQPSGVRETVRGTNANLTINGMAVTSASNTVADAAQGVTLTLNKVGTTSLSVTRDLDNVKSAVQAFVSAFNNLHNMAGKLTAVDSTTKTGSVLTGDGVLRGIQTKLRNILNASAGSAAGGISNLAQIGLSFQKDGSLAIDDTKLSKALKDNVSGVTRLFVGEGKADGYAKQISTAIDDLNGDKGALKLATDGLDKSLKDLQKDYTKTQDNINANMERYRAQFAKLDLVVQRMNQTSSYLTQQFNAINNTNNNKN